MGKPLILKGFWNVRRLKKYRQKKLKIGRECGKNKGKYKMKAVKTTEKQEYLFEYSCFFFKNSISFSK